MLSLLAFCCFITFCHGSHRPRAHTEYGDVLGTQWYSFKGRRFNVFMSIPFAEKPVGDLRFEDTKEPKKWFEPIDGGVPSPECIQNSRPNFVTGDEDCLYINVFTPILDLQNATSLLPVIAFIPGGAFYFFSGLTFGPRYLLDKDVVLVTFNYRLGIFVMVGFLSTQDEVMPGNAAMKDQVMALGWIQRNIHNFGGDPSSVTLMGMSAGAVSVHYHYFSVLSRGLFHRGYMLGGNAFNVWAVQKKPRQKAEASARWVGCPTNSSRLMVDCLKKKPARKLAQTVALFKTAYGPLAGWAPVVDRWSRNPFIKEYPIQSILGRRHYNVPLIISDAVNAGLFPAAAYIESDQLMAELDYDWDKYGPYFLDAQETLEQSEKDRVMEIIKTHYFGRHKSIYQNLTSFVQMVSDRLYLADMGKGASFHAACNARVYFYLNNFSGIRSTTDDFLGPENKLGVAHIDDLYYLMNRTWPESIESSHQDVNMINRLTEMLYHYAKTGNAVFLPGVSWPPLQGPSPRFTYLRVDSPDSAEVTSTENFGDGQFWDGLPLNEPWAGRNLG